MYRCIVCWFAKNENLIKKPCYLTSIDILWYHFVNLIVVELEQLSDGYSYFRSMQTTLSIVLSEENAPFGHPITIYTRFTAKIHFVLIPLQTQPVTPQRFNRLFHVQFSSKLTVTTRISNENYLAKQMVSLRNGQFLKTGFENLRSNVNLLPITIENNSLYLWSLLQTNQPSIFEDKTDKISYANSCGKSFYSGICLFLDPEKWTSNLLVLILLSYFFEARRNF